VRRRKTFSTIAPAGAALAMCFNCVANAASEPSSDATAATSDASAATADATAATPDAAASTSTTGNSLEQVTVTAERLSLMGKATTASEGVVVNEELALTPAYRVGQLLETVPGLQVTSHSGEGKANQYLLRGYNLDHGTDLATFIDGMPVNEPTHAHGQGYTDLNFLIPELATNIAYTKGTYYADEGDFASVGSVHISYLNRIDPQVSFTAGTFGYQRLFAGDSTDFADGALLGALEAQHYDGPWVNSDDLRKVNAVLRYSRGDNVDGFSVTGSFYHGLWNATTDQPERAIEAGLIGRFGSLDPSDGGKAQRANLTMQYHQTVADGQLNASAYVFNNQLTLWNNFTHFLVDPVNGDQEAQHENRTTVGGTVNYEKSLPVFGIENVVLVGAMTRNDINDVSRLPTEDRVVIPASDDPLNFSETDSVHLDSQAAYVQTTTHWTSWFRSVLGLRYDHMNGEDHGTNTGTASGNLAQPKGSLIFRPVESTELYASAGRGFHSDDLRGVTSSQASGVAGAPLIAHQTGEEIGIRQEFTHAFTMTLALYSLDAQSETTYDPDAGVDGAGPGSRRRGFELNMTYQATKWLEFYGSYSANHARFTTPFDDGTGHVGEYLPNAPFATGSFNVYVKNLGPWSGGLEYRYLSAYPLSSDDVVQGHGYGEWSGDAHYEIGSGWSTSLGIYNLTNKHADAAEFWYIDRLPGEPAAGEADLHVHPLEPLSARLTIAKKF
jgi:outer membrane receptor protein involved in Fe transport